MMMYTCSAQGHNCDRVCSRPYKAGSRTECTLIMVLYTLFIVGVKTSIPVSLIPWIPMDPLCIIHLPLLYNHASRCMRDHGPLHVQAGLNEKKSFSTLNAIPTHMYRKITKHFMLKWVNNIYIGIKHWKQPIADTPDQSLVLFSRISPPQT